MAPRPLRRIRKRRLGAALAALAGAFPLGAWVGSAVPVNADWAEPERGIDIMVETNGLHTGIVVPVTSPQMDWRRVFPSASRPLASGEYPTHLAIGWGEREVFLNVPEWTDLTPGTVLRIATVGGDALMRVDHYVRPVADEHHRALRISTAQYARLVTAIQSALPPATPGTPRPIIRGTDNDAAYYPATGTYTLATTCNTWTGEVLAQAGVKTGWWTPFAGGVMKWVPVRD